MYNVLHLAVEEMDGIAALNPSVDGTELVETVRAFEEGQGFTPAGGYGGLVPAHFRFGDLNDYYRGIAMRQWPRRGRLWLLGCDYGEVGC